MGVQNRSSLCQNLSSRMAVVDGEAQHEAPMHSSLPGGIDEIPTRALGGVCARAGPSRREVAGNASTDGWATDEGGRREGQQPRGPWSAALWVFMA